MIVEYYTYLTLYVTYGVCVCDLWHSALMDQPILLGALQKDHVVYIHCKKGIVIWTSHLLSEWQVSERITYMDS